MSGRTRNRVLMGAAIVLVIMLLAIIAWLLRNGDTTPGVVVGPSPQPVFMISGPDEGDFPAFSRPLAVAWAPNGEIYVADTGNGRICVFDAGGRFVREFGRLKAPKSGVARVLKQPAGMTFGPDGNIYVADVRGGAVLVFDGRGSLVKRIRPRTSAGANQRRWTPTDVAVTGDRIYVTDATGVAVFSADGSLKSRIDSTSDGVRFSYPNGIAARPDGTLVVSDTNNRRVVSIDSTGTLEWTGRSSDGTTRLVGLPRGLGLAPDGSVLVADAFLFGVEHLSADGVAVERYGKRGSLPGFFQFPNDADVRSDRVLVADKENNRVQVIQWPGLSNTADR